MGHHAINGFPGVVHVGVDLMGHRVDGESSLSDLYWGRARTLLSQPCSLVKHTLLLLLLRRGKVMSR